MSNIYNFANRNLCEYASIFPTVVALLDHLLFTIGNGYDFDKDSGMIFNDDVRIDEYPEMTDAEWKELIEACHAKELRWANDYVRYNPDGLINKEKLAEDCAKYKIFTVDDSMFTEESLYAELIETKRLRIGGMDDLLRPYPLSEKYSDVYNLNVNTPTWFVQITLNLCKAWVRFLTEELETGNVYVKPPATLKGEQFIGSADDYANLEWTTRHRDMLVTQVQRLEGLIMKETLCHE